MEAGLERVVDLPRFEGHSFRAYFRASRSVLQTGAGPDLKTLKPRLHYLLGAASAHALGPVVAGDAARMIQMAGEFIEMI
jgi:hypothetical protein